MDLLRLDTLAGHLVDWHNRRFWARRITVSHVQSMGYVVLPLVDPAGSAALPVLLDEAPPGPGAAGDGTAGATLRERAIARAQQGAATADAAPAATAAAASPAGAAANPAATLLKAAFSEDFIPPLKAAAVASFASRHGAAHAQPGKDAQVRQVLADAAAERGLHQRWLLTAQIQVGRSRTRVLVGSGLSPAVLGRRLPNTPLLALGLALLAVGMAAGWAVLRPAAEPAPAAPAASAASAALPASAASASADASAPPAATVWAVALPDPAAAAASVAVGASALEGTAAAAVASAGSAASAAAAMATAVPNSRVPLIGMPPDAEPTLGQVQLPSLGPIIDERRRTAAAARAAAAASAASAAGAGTGATATTAGAKPAAPTATTPARQVAQSLVGAPAFAVSTRLLRTRTEGELVAEAMRALLIGPNTPGMHVEAMKAGDDWRVVGWPYVDRAQAERARAFLATRGMKVEVIDF